MSECDSCGIRMRDMMQESSYTNMTMWKLHLSQGRLQSGVGEMLFTQGAVSVMKSLDYFLVYNTWYGPMRSGMTVSRNDAMLKCI